MLEFSDFKITSNRIGSFLTKRGKQINKVVRKEIPGGKTSQDIATRDRKIIGNCPNNNDYTTPVREERK